MKQVTLSDIDIQTIVDALRLRHAVMINTLLTSEDPPKQQVNLDPPVQKPVEHRYGFKKDGTPRRPPGRPRKSKKKA